MPDDSSPASHFGTAYWIVASRARESERVDRLPDDPYPTVLAGTRGRAAVDRLDQVVLLGAALDTRAFRLPLPAQLRWFEIDRAKLLEVALRIRANAPLIARSTEPSRRRTEPGRKYGVIPDRHVRTSHSLAVAPRTTVPGERHTCDPREAREGRTPIILAIGGDSVRSAHMKQSLKSRLFGIAMTLSVFAASISVVLGKRW